MLKISPSQRISAEEILSTHIVDYNKTMKRTNSNPLLLNTIKMPRDMLRLKAILPEKRYKNALVDKFKSDLSDYLVNNEIKDLKDKIGIENNEKDKLVKNAHSLMELNSNSNGVEKVYEQLINNNRKNIYKNRKEKNDNENNKKNDKNNN